MTLADGVVINDPAKWSERIILLQTIGMLDNRSFKHNVWEN